MGGAYRWGTLAISDVLGAVVMDVPDGILPNQLPKFLTGLKEDVGKAPRLYDRWDIVAERVM